MVVEVTLQQRSKPPKSCWYPFKHRRQLLLTAASAAVDRSRSAPRIATTSSSSSSSSSSRNRKRQDVVNGGSVATDQSSLAPSHLSEDSSSDQTGMSLSQNTGTSSSSPYSAAVERAFLKNGPPLPPQQHVRSQRRQRSPNSIARYMPALDDEEDSIVISDPITGAVDALLYPSSREFDPLALAMVETNCMSKEFWTDEVVEPGGAFACLAGAARRTKCLPEPVPEELQEISDDATLNSIVDPDDDDDDGAASLVDEDSGEWQSQSVRHGKQRVGFGGVQYISDEPLDIKEKSAVRRAMCNNIRLRKKKSGKSAPGKKTMEPTSLVQQQSSSSQLDSDQVAMRSSSTAVASTTNNSSSLSSRLTTPTASSQSTSKGSSSSMASSWKDCPSSDNVHDKWIRGIAAEPKRIRRRLPPGTLEEEEALNFYVEVEAMREQLNGIRDLEELEAEDDVFEEEIEVARAASLVDDDSTFMESVDDPTRSKKRQQNRKSALRLLECGGGSARDHVGQTYQSTYSFPAQQSMTSRSNVTSRLATISETQGRPRSSKSNQQKNGLKEQEMATPIPLTRSISQRVAQRSLEMSQNQEEDMSAQTDAESPGRMSSASLSSLELNKIGAITDKSSDTFLFPGGQVAAMPHDRGGSDDDAVAMSVDSGSPRRSEIQSSMVVSPDRRGFDAGEASWNEPMDTGSANIGEWQTSETGYYRKAASNENERIDSPVSNQHLHPIIDQSWSVEGELDAEIDMPANRVVDNSYQSSGDKKDNRSLDRLPSEVVSSPGAPKFDDNFWQEDGSGLDTTAFEEFDNEQDSLFGDLKSTVSTPDISSKSSQSEPSPGSYRGYLHPGVLYGHNDNHPPERPLANPRRYGAESSRHSPTARSKDADISMRYSTTEHNQESDAQSRMSQVSRTSDATPFFFREEEDW